MVICENAYWFAKRSSTPWSVTTPISISQPFFIKQGKKILESPPLYRNWIYDLPSMLKSDKQLKHKFIFKTTFYLIRDDYRKFVWVLKLAFFQRTNESEATDYFYTELQKICLENGAKLLVVGLDEQRFKPNNEISLVETHNALLNFAKANSKGMEIFEFRYGNPPKLYDAHYNELAHKIIANEVLKFINLE